MSNLSEKDFCYIIINQLPTNGKYLYVFDKLYGISDIILYSVEYIPMQNFQLGIATHQKANRHL